MIEGRGGLRLTDFGLAARGELGKSDVAAGTPGYIAPESIAGRETTVRSDVYSLGLVLYELYTGSPAYPGTKNTDLLTTQSRQDPVAPGIVAPDIDARVERVIQQCLEREPRLRPGSARHVAAFLPGGSPLAATIAAGETPSPEMVAAAGQQGRIPTMRVVLGLALVAVALVGAVILKSNASLIGRVMLPKSGEVLADRARQIIAELGYPEPHPRERYSFDVYEELLVEIMERDQSASRWERLSRPRPGAIDFWYRRFPNPVRTRGALGRVSWEDPAQQEPGMVSVRLSPLGQLREFAVIDDDTFGEETPGRRPTEGESKVREPDWSVALRAADLDPDLLQRVEPERVPQVFADCRAAWDGSYPESPDVRIRVEAAGFRGRVVALRLIEQQFPRASGPSAPADLWIHGRPWAGWLLDALNLAVLVGTIVLARNNIRYRRGDRPGARRVGLWVFMLSLVSLLAMSSAWFAPTGQPPPLVMFIGLAMLNGAWFWMAYLGVEPYLRRLWPESIISWTRLLSGRWRDPLVGWHVLTGVAMGVIAVAAVSIDQLAPEWVGDPSRAPMASPNLTAAALAGPREALGAVLSTVSNSLRAGLVFLLVMVGLRLILKRKAIAGIAFVILQTAVWSSSLSNTPITWLLIGSLTTLLAIATIRFGLLTLVTAVFVYVVLIEMPITTNLGAWHGGVSMFAIAIPAAMAVYGAMTAIGGRRAGETWPMPVHSEMTRV
jgi:serine/threonine-protein kinase